MKRTIGVTMAALALIAVSAVAWADPPANTEESKTDAAAAAPAQAAPPAHVTGHSSAHAMTDLNAASRETLLRLPGITDEIADKIIGARPFKSRAELVSKNIVTKAEFAKIRYRVTAKATPTAAK